MTKCKYCSKKGVYHPMEFKRGFKGKPGKRTRCKYCHRWQDMGSLY